MNKQELFDAMLLHVLVRPKSEWFDALHSIAERAGLSSDVLISFAARVTGERLDA